MTIQAAEEHDARRGWVSEDGLRLPMGSAKIRIQQGIQVSLQQLAHASGKRDRFASLCPAITAARWRDTLLPTRG